ncbi:uncharacterized protein TRAVEDRAFT_23469 [Trametes versicolor FP-101664 SS1]|uniref:uncharacterized protein n=1 Tax=Trametes versicolor (strain FP-101664) TaxID=717944 RepID=UPI0004622656|nr:uncharacterized protein TRAVEDRAFT_23469 [Trametes versicolor FP-101664 SS1]EIW54378.1 hypothetical protein TRAVEDRAFT_23469 [Trametes versicolor FP-101664 SS1]
MSSRALQKTDILHEIIEKYADLEGGCTTDEQRQQLASLCRVCKTFYDLAVKVLWARLPSLRPLLSLLPEFDYAYRLYIFSGSTQPFQCTLSKSVSPEDWTRFRQHAALVRNLANDVRSLLPCNYLLSGDGWSHLGRLLAGAPLLPSLRDLVWEPMRTYEDFTLLVSPSLRNLSLRCTWSAQSGSETTPVDPLREALNKTHVLTSLRITDFDSNLLALFTSEELIGLEDVQIRVQALDRLARTPMQAPAYGYPNAASLRVLSTLPALKRLQIDFRSPGAGFDFQGFRALRNLRMTDCGGDVLALLGTFRSPELRQLVLIFSSGPFTPAFSWREMHSLCSTIARHSPRLEHLTLMFMTIRHVERASEATLAAVRPLLDLHDLKEVRLWSGKEAIGFSDAVLTAFAEAWPVLLSLSLCCHTDRTFTLFDPPSEGDPDPHAVTLRALAAFAQHCKSLDNLRLPLLYVPAGDIADPPATLGHPLRSLGICRARIADARACAVVVGRMFPGLEVGPSRDDTTFCINSFAPGTSEWLDVLPALESIRGEEEAAVAGQASESAA